MVEMIDINDKTYVDDTYGNLIDASGDTVSVVSISLESSQIIFNDIAGVPYTASFPSSTTH